MLSASRCRAALLACLIALLSAPPADAGRVVGVLFDDSGSMAQNIQLPTFGMQLLVGTLDGRPGRDRLLTIRLSDFVTAFPDGIVTEGGRQTYRPVLPDGIASISPATVEGLIANAEMRGSPLIERWNLADRAQLQASIDKIAEAWPLGRSWTPYEPLEILLHALVEETGPGEVAHLVVLTDGAFYAGAPFLPEGVADSLRAYRSRLQGELRVHFLLTVNKPDPRPLVERQGVRRALLEVFDGQSYEITSHDTMLAAVLAVIGEISLTDPTLDSDLVRHDGATIELETPFGLTGLVSIGVGPADRPAPVLAAVPFEAAREIHLEAAMRDADNQLTDPPRIPGWPETRLVGAIAQIEPLRPLPPGTYRLGYSGPTEDAVKLLLRTTVRIEVGVLDPDGTELPAGPGGLEVARGAPYRLELAILDGAANGDREVDPLALPEQATATVTLRQNGRTQAVEAELDRERRRFVVEPWRVEWPGEVELSATLRVPGLLVAPSRSQRLLVGEPSVAFSVVVEPLEACPGDCAADEVPIALGRAPAPLEIARVRVTPTGSEQGAMRLALEGPADGLVLLDARRRALGPDTLLELVPDQPLELRLTRAPDWRPPATTTGPLRLTLEIAAAPPLQGLARHSLTLLPHYPEARLVYVGHSQDPSGAHPLVLDLAALRRGRQALDFVLEGSLDLPRPDEFSAGAGPLFTTGAIELELERIAIFPQLPVGLDWLGCGCLTALLSRGDHNVALRWQPAHGLQAATADAPLRFAPSLGETVWACLMAFLRYLLVAQLLAWLVYFFLRARRFPPHSRLLVREHGHALPRHTRLRGSWPAHALRCFFWFVPGWRVDESRKVEGLELVAGSGGVRLVGRRGWPPFDHRDFGQSLEEIARLRGGDPTIELPWGSELIERVPRGRRLLLVENARAAAQSAYAT